MCTGLQSNCLLLQLSVTYSRSSFYPFWLISGIVFCPVLLGVPIIIVVTIILAPRRGFLLEECDLHPFVPGPCLASLGHMLSSSCLLESMKKIRKKCRENHHRCISLFPGRILLKSCALDFKTTSLLLSTRSPVFEMCPVCPLIRGHWLLCIFPSSSERYLYNVKPVIFGESLSSSADVFRNRMN